MEAQMHGKNRGLFKGFRRQCYKRLSRLSKQKVECVLITIIKLYQYYCHTSFELDFDLLKSVKGFKGKSNT